MVMDHLKQYRHPPPPNLCSFKKVKKLNEVIIFLKRAPDFFLCWNEAKLD
jgi:hypothetical protein